MNYFLISKENFFSTHLFNLLNKEKDLDNSVYGRCTHYYNWTFISDKKILTEISLDPKTVKLFFFHWSYIVPKKIYTTYECINLHTSNLPDGKGGSPIQNQIMENILFTKVNALRMSVDGLDSGPVYNSREITLQGSLNDIWITITCAAFKLIKDIIIHGLKPVKQVQGNFVTYKRRKDNEIPFLEKDLLEIYNFIRMLDNKDYPNPFIKIGDYILEFSRANFDGEKIISDVSIKKL